MERSCPGCRSFGKYSASYLLAGRGAGHAVCSMRPRGWSDGLIRAGSDGLLPAPVGMVPSRTSRWMASSAAPCTRGDGPESSNQPILPNCCSPPTCGDGPVTTTMERRIMDCSPHPRGCSHARGGPCAHTSPVPRTRGDGPDPAKGEPGAPGCSPHLRGWSRGLHERAVRVRLLRTRGDGPSLSMAELARLFCSPHSRGWSQHPVRPHPGVLLLPAPAGMVPSASRVTWRR